MSRIYAQQKRPGAKAAAPSYDAPAVHAPSLVSGQSNSDLDALMQAKYRQHFMDNQIPTAEAEADRIAASVSGARTPEEVKTQLGEKMGADFSNVTFHTDSAALKQADAMGARAYTSGSDVYFGQGGFDPGVAAHELVHTVQQGMVGSTMQTTSAPTGGVQMMANPFKALGRGLKRIGNIAAAPFRLAALPFKLIGANAYQKVKSQADNDQLMMPSRTTPLQRHYAAKIALQDLKSERYNMGYNFATNLGNDKETAMQQASAARNEVHLTRNPFKRHAQVEKLLLHYLGKQQERRDAAGRGSIWDELDEQ